MWRWVGLAAALGLVAGSAAAAPAEGGAPAAAKPPPPAVVALPADTVVVKEGPPAAGAGTRPFGFTHVVVRIPDGTAWVNARGGIFCVPQGARTWTSGQQQEQIKVYMDALRPQMKDAGFSVDGDPDNIFAPATSTADLQLAAVITAMHFDFCSQMAGYGSTAISGTATMQVQWQLYSTIEKTVIAKIDTSGTAKVESATHATFNTLLTDVFKANVDQLIAAPDFRKALAAPPTDPSGVVRPQTLAAISLPGAAAAKGRPVSDVVGSVVLISAGQAEGSGFLVSSDGLLLTDQHVVGDAKYVKVRWPDGAEGLGEVVRADKVRDVALVKTDAHGRQPIRIHREAMQPGDTVFAIGAPLGDRFQSTVTRGVVSAYRTFDGVSFIQSDVSVNPGSSGGPLLDEKGEAVGLTESGYQGAGAPTGINLFVPIGDALDFLNAQPQ
ncbi:MAG TPA: trypsin-like peptidase domain-containing protein [Caulobacteraceae bacterium]